jgi:hypothetical protein
MAQGSRGGLKTQTVAKQFKHFTSRLNAILNRPNAISN